jgi:hypothetical protein
MYLYAYYSICMHTGAYVFLCMHVYCFAYTSLCIRTHVCVFSMHIYVPLCMYMYIISMQTLVYTCKLFLCMYMYTSLTCCGFVTNCDSDSRITLDVTSLSKNISLYCDFCFPLRIRSCISESELRSNTRKFTMNGH